MSATSRAGRAMAGGLRRRRLLGVSPRTLAARHAQAIERALDLGDQPGRNTGVAGRRLQLLVSERTRAIMLTFYAIETEGSVAKDPKLAGAARAFRDTRPSLQP